MNNHRTWEDFVACIIPTYNPCHKFEPLIYELLNAGFKHIIVINDGSTKNTIYFKKVKEIQGITLLTQQNNKGKGAAIKLGYKHCLSDPRLSNIRTLITLDADGQHAISDAIKLANEAEKLPNKIILGARTFSNNTPLKSFLGNQITRKVFSIFSGVKLLDTQTGLRAIPIEFAKKSLDIKSNRYEFELESLLLARKLGYHFHEVKIETLYFENNANSHFRPILDSLKIYYIFLRFSFISILSSILDISLFSLLLLFSNSITISTFSARGISAIFNFHMNKYNVFKSSSQSSLSTQALAYSLLCIFIACSSAYLVEHLSSITDTPVVITKILVDGFLFVFSFIVQKYWIFDNATQPSNTAGNVLDTKNDF